MQPNDTPAVSRYNAIIKRIEDAWEETEQFNTLGIIAVTGITSIILNSDNLFKENKTNVKYSVHTIGGDLTMNMTGFSVGEITLEYSAIPEVGDSVLIEIEVFNN